MCCARNSRETVAVTSCCLLCVCPGYTVKHVKTHLSLSQQHFPIHSFIILFLHRKICTESRQTDVCRYGNILTQFISKGVWEISRGAYFVLVCEIHTNNFAYSKHRERANARGKGELKLQTRDDENRKVWIFMWIARQKSEMKSKNCMYTQNSTVARSLVCSHWMNGAPHFPRATSWICVCCAYDAD